MSQKFSLLNFFGRPFSPLYSAVMRAREFCYHRRILRSYRLHIPVISVGNLTMGGTGKTPVVAYIASLMQDMGYTPAIVSRGYGGKADERVNVVSDGKKVLLDAKDAGDEPCFLGHKLPGIHVLTGIVRILPCKYAQDHAKCDAIILDDGFQHLAVQRDLDLVLFSGASLAGNSRVFPGGDLREPVSALRRCSSFVITGVNEELFERATRFKELLEQRFPGKPVFFTSYKAQQAQSLTDKSICQLADLPGPLFAFCGIGQPNNFYNSLQSNNIEPVGFLPLKDHHPFTSSLLKKINKQALSCGAAGLITTEKDFVKLRPEQFKLPLFSLQMQVEPSKEFHTYLKSEISAFKA